MARFTWAKIYCDLLRHPLLRDRPDCDVRLVLGLILDAKEHTDDGVLRRMTAQSAKRLCNISSPVAKVQAGIDYLVSVGWLIPHPDQAYEIKDFIPRQAADSAAERAARWRDDHQHERVTKRDGESQRKRNDGVTKRDAPVTASLPEVEEEEEVDTEKIKTTSAQSAEKAQPPTPETDFQKFVLESWPDVKDLPGFEARAREANPGIDLLAEAKKARGWELSDPKRVKRNHGKFLWGWLSRAQDSASRGLFKPKTPALQISEQSKVQAATPGRKFV